jgi:hypothetical protein
MSKLNYPNSNLSDADLWLAPLFFLSFSHFILLIKILFYAQSVFACLCEIVVFTFLSLSLFFSFLFYFACVLDFVLEDHIFSTGIFLFNMLANVLL